MKTHDPPLSRSERWLAIALRAVGILDLFALVAVAMPFEWSAAAHKALGMGELPERPVVEYLIRSASLLYAAHAVLMLYLSFDVRRYGPFIGFLGWMILVQGAILGMIDWHAGLPLWWTIQEPVAYGVIGTVFLVLRRGASRMDAPSQADRADVMPHAKAAKDAKVGEV